MGHWSDPIEIGFPELFSSLDRSGFPELADNEEGLCLHADNLSFESGLFACNLLLSFAFSRKFFGNFRRVGRAINIIIENADTGQCHRMNLEDPHKTYPSLAGDNHYSGSGVVHPGVKTAYREIPLTIELDNPGWGPHVFFRAVLQDHSSNILALNLFEEVSVCSFVDGKQISQKLSAENSESGG
jgi:hypothetical protein